MESGPVGDSNTGDDSTADLACQSQVAYTFSTLMNLTYFKTYLEVVKRGGFSEAGKALGLSQPTVSFHIQRLEEDLTTKLLERQGGRIVVTPAGVEFQAFAERVLQELSSLEQRLGALQEEVAGKLSLGASTNPGEYILPRIVGAFRQLFPKVSASISIADTAEIVDKVMDRQCDAGFVGAEVKRRGLDVRKIAEDQLLLIAPPGHPFTTRPSVGLSDLEQEPFVLRQEGSGTQKTVEELMHANGLNPSKLKATMVAGSNQAVVTAVEAGMGLAFASQMAAARSLELGRVKTVPLDGVSWVRGIYFIKPSRSVETKLMKEFTAFVDRWSAG